MKNKNTNYRRIFVKLAGAALVALSAVSASFAQTNTSNSVTPVSNNLRQLYIFAALSEPNPTLPGVFGLAGYQFQMRATVGGSGGGIATLSDPVFTEINSHIKIESYRELRGNLHVFGGTVIRSLSAELIGKPVVIEVQILPNDRCDVSLTIQDANEAVLIALLIPAIQKSV